MWQSELNGTVSWAHLPEAEPPARLKAAVLADWERAHGKRPGRMAGVAAGLAVAALFVMAVTLPLRMQHSNAVDPAALALLRAQGLEVIASPAAAAIPVVRRVATGSAADRLGLLPGDRLLSVDLPMNPDGMMNVAVLRGDSAKYFALPGVARRGSEPDAGMANSSGRAGSMESGVAVATPHPDGTSLPQTLV